MKKRNLSNCFESAIVLFIDILLVCFLIALVNVENTSFTAISVVLILIFLFVFNLKTFIVYAICYKLTKWIEKPVLRDILLNYHKLTTILLLNAIPVSFVISIFILPPPSDYSSDTFTLGFGIMMMFMCLIIFNFGVPVIYFLTKIVKLPILRNILFYTLLLLWYISPVYFFF